MASPAILVNLIKFLYKTWLLFSLQDLYTTDSDMCTWDRKQTKIYYNVPISIKAKPCPQNIQLQNGLIYQNSMTYCLNCELYISKNKPSKLPPVFTKCKHNNTTHQVVSNIGNNVKSHGPYNRILPCTQFSFRVSVYLCLSACMCNSSYWVADGKIIYVHLHELYTLKLPGVPICHIVMTIPQHSVKLLWYHLQCQAHLLNIYFLS